MKQKNHNSWTELSPYKFTSGTEDFSSYLSRVHSEEKYHHIPEMVLEQWIFPHYENEWMIKNYGWIDYSSVEFQIQKWSCSQLQEVKAIEVFEHSILGFGNEFNSLSASEMDKQYWEKYCTWRVPPIILDTSSIVKDAPAIAELHLPYQLIEGHTRMRNLRIAYYQKLPLKDSHAIYLMRAIN